MEPWVTLEELRRRIAALPRVNLAFLPTPLHEVPRFARALGGPRIFMKREDQTGLAFGGNKTRMFDFLMARVKEAGADTIVGGAAVQSNYSRQLAAAGRAIGCDVHLVLRRVRGPRDDDIQGNLLLDLLSGASVRVIDGTMEEQRQVILDLAEDLRKEGKTPYVARMANDEDFAPDTIAYTECFCEIVEQSRALGMDPTHIYVSAYDTTQAGLELGKWALGMDVRILGISPAEWEGDIPAVLLRCMGQAAEVLGLDCEVDRAALYNTLEYVGAGYGRITPEALAMIKLMARSEGIFLDPVYTGKACAALADHVRRGLLKEEDRVVFIHTGGTPALFAYRDELGLEELKSRLSGD
jgi:1-aminocyclopropane-1-carboxylate deaminase/D-cysteine desulfhydrase-like pyridoxal-dependent ACC family enzyme